MNSTNGVGDCLENLAKNNQGTGENIVFKNAEKAHATLTEENRKREQEEARKVYSARLVRRIWLFVASSAFGVLSFLLMKENGMKTLYLEEVLFGMLSWYFFLKMFYIGIGRSVKQRRRLRASLIIWLTIIWGILIMGGCANILLLYEDEETAGLYMLFVIIVWILALVLSIVNKILVNVHNQD